MKSSLSQQNHNITQAQGLTFVNKFQQSNSETSPSAYFDQEAVQALLNIEGARGLRYYYGKDELDQAVLLLVPTDNQGEDLLEANQVLIGQFMAPQERLSHQSEVLSVEVAGRYSARYRADIQRGERTGGAFNREGIERVLQQEDQLGLSWHYGMDEQGLRNVVISGVSTEGLDKWEGVLAEYGKPCPPDCSWLNPLNSSLISMRGVVLKEE